jgi:hypothetical protein
MLNKNYSVKSSLGGLMTLFFITLVGITFFIYFQDIVNRTTPIVISKSQFSKDLPFWSNNRLEIGFRTNLFFDNKMYTSSFSNFFKLSSYYKIIIHDGDNFENIVQEKDMKFQKYYVLELDPNQTYVQNPSISVELSDEFLMSKNNTDIFKNAHAEIQIFPFIYNIDPENYENPIIQTRESFRIVLDSRYKFNYIFEYIPQYLLSDDGILFSNKKNFTKHPLLTLSNFPIIEKNEKYPGDITIMSFEPYLSRETKIISRTYKRISDVLANVGGIANIISLIFKIFINFYSTFIRNEEIINYLFFNEEKPKESSMVKKDTKIKQNVFAEPKIDNKTKNKFNVITPDISKRSINQIEMIKSSDLIEKDLQNNESLEKIEFIRKLKIYNSIKKRKEKFKFSFLEYIRVILFKCLYPKNSNLIFRYNQHLR